MLVCYVKLLKYIRYSIELVLVLSVFFIIYLFGNPVGGKAPPYFLPRRIASECEYIFARLEHLGHLTNVYMSKNGIIPEGNFSVTELLHLLRSEEENIDDPHGYEGLLQFLASCSKSSDLFEMLSPRAVAAIDDYTRRGEEFNDIGRYSGDRFIKNCFIKRSAVSPDNICIGVIRGRDSYANHYSKILASIRDGYYFSDVFGTPYDGKDTLVITLEIPNDEDE